MSYSQKVCDNLHEGVDKTLMRHETVLNEHGSKLDCLEQQTTKNATNIENLLSAIKTQYKAMWGLGALFAAAIINQIVQQWR